MVLNIFLAVLELNCLSLILPFKYSTKSFNLCLSINLISVLVKKVMMPPLSLLSDGVNLENKKLILRKAQPNEIAELSVQEVAINYGQLIETFIDFLIVGFTIFLVIKFINKLNKQAENPKDQTVPTPKNIELLLEMNELLKEQNKILKENNN